MAATYIFPTLVVCFGYFSVRYYYLQDSPSKIMSPYWFDTKQPILVNEKTIDGGVPVEDIIKFFPDSENAFEPVYRPHNDTETDYMGFREEVFQYSAFKRGEQPYNMGCYLFYKMDRETHDYQIMTFFNATSYHSMNLFP